MDVHDSYPESSRQPAAVTTGVVWSETLVETARPAMSVSRTHFSPGARTCWHEHHLAQVLLIETGVALVQEDGEPVRAVQAGGAIACEPGVRHWHGAAPTYAMTQLAITHADPSGNYARWGPQVTDEEYARHDQQPSR